MFDAALQPRPLGSVAGVPGRTWGFAEFQPGCSLLYWLASVWVGLIITNVDAGSLGKARLCPGRGGPRHLDTVRCYKGTSVQVRPHTTMHASSGAPNPRSAPRRKTNLEPVNKKQHLERCNLHGTRKR